ncbi:hypothetical protein HGM15179_004914, partial [Zosterops borbonicus]
AKVCWWGSVPVGHFQGTPLREHWRKDFSTDALPRHQHQLASLAFIFWVRLWLESSLSKQTLQQDTAEKCSGTGVRTTCLMKHVKLHYIV